MTHYSAEMNSMRRRCPLGQHCIEGQYVTVLDIAKRLGVTQRLARNALHRARRVAGDSPVTWKLLGVKS